MRLSQIVKHNDSKEPKKKRRNYFLIILSFLAGCLAFPIFILLFNISASDSFQTDIKSKIIRALTPRSYDFSWSNFKTGSKHFYQSLFASPDELFLNADFKNFNLFQAQLGNTALRSLDNDFDNSKGSLKFKKTEYKIKFRPKGDRSIHYRKEKPSIRVSMENGESFLGMSDFSLQSPVIRNYIAEYAWIEALKEEKIITPKYGFLRLFINAKNYGIYSYEEAVSTFMLERQGMRNSAIVGFSESRSTYIQDTPVIRIFNQKEVSQGNAQLAVALFDQFIKGKRKLTETFEVNKLATFFALSDLFQTHHGLASKSVRFYYNPFTNLLEPIPFDGHSGTNLKDDYITWDFSFENPSWLNADKQWFQLFFNPSNQAFISLYFSKLENFSNKKFIQKLLKSGLREKVNKNLAIIYKDIPLEDRINYQGPYPYYYDIDKVLTSTAEKIKQRLKETAITASSFYNKKNKQLTLDLRNTTTYPLPVSIKQIGTKDGQLTVKDTVFFLSKKKTLFTLSDTILISQLSETATLNIDYAVSGTEKKASLKITPYLLDSISTPLSSDLLEQLVRSGKILKKGQRYTLSGSQLDISEKLIIPKDHSFQLNAGSKIRFLTKQAGLISHGSVYCYGTASNPVLFSGVGGYKGYILAVNNDSCHFEYTHFSDLSSPADQDVSGSITLYKSKNYFSHCVLNGNNNEDFLNLVSSTARIENCIIQNVHSDAIDADFSTASITNTQIRITGNDAVDGSGSQINISNVDFSKIGDKCISAGEESRFTIQKSTLSDADLGIVCKDGSIVNATDLLFSSIKIPLILFTKKNRYTEPSMSIAKTRFERFVQRDLIQKGLALTLDGQVLVGNLKDVEGLLYGNTFGKKTIR